MFKISHYLIAIITIFLVSCERSTLSPVEIKIDENHGGILPKTSALLTYVVSGNETLFDVANRYNIDPMNLAKINGIAAPYKVRRGQVLRLPDNGIATSAKSVEKEIPTFNDDSSPKEEKKKDELDEEFEDVILGKGSFKPGDSKESREVGMSFNEQAKALSSPKITETVAGEPIKKKSKKDREKKEVAKAKDEKSPKPIEKLQEAFKPVDQEKPPKMIRPVDGEIISKFGDVKDGVSNDGINIKAPIGTEVKAADGGTVIYVGSKLEEYGNIVIVQHKDGLITSYAHLKDVSVKNGAAVKSGDSVGTVGKSGDVDEPQLYFEVMKDKKPVNPSKYLEK